jgi:hypothetical protein
LAPIPPTTAANVWVCIAEQPYDVLLFAKIALFTSRDEEFPATVIAQHLDQIRTQETRSTSQEHPLVLPKAHGSLLLNSIMRTLVD